MTSPIDELTVAWSEDGEPRVRELDRRVLAEGNWATIAFHFCERASDGTWRAPKVQVRRYQKRRNGYVFHSKFIVPSDEQGHALGAALLQWCSPKKEAPQTPEPRTPEPENPEPENPEPQSSEVPHDDEGASDG
ncbi:MAG: hypothetical protein ACYTFT_10585 [Planctomycetota bacterium]|jgi:hypothetical protein